jgi:hypothetical protein
MSSLIELLLYVFARPVLKVALGLFGYDLDWESKDGREKRDGGWSLPHFFAVPHLGVCSEV